MTARTGIGYDVHAFAGGRRLVIGGVEIPYERGLQGHSDADVLTHAVMDALLGAAGLGDIGDHFPDADPSFKDADSVNLLHRVVDLVAEHGWKPANVDATVIMEAPRLADYRYEIAATLAGALKLGREAVNVKATTNEGMGFIGRGEGAAALAVATVEAA